MVRSLTKMITARIISGNGRRDTDQTSEERENESFHEGPQRMRVKRAVRAACVNYC